jgi:small subunit ribosomal protein S4
MPRKPRHKTSRRFGVDIYGTGGASLRRRMGTPPGGVRRRRRRESLYAEGLNEKQKAKAIYGVEERQMRRYFEHAGRQAGNRGENLLVLLERRLDNVVYRLGFARTRPMARQLIGHGHVRLNGRRVDIPSALVESGQQLTISSEAAAIPTVIEELGSGRPLPGWLERVDSTGRVVRLPERGDIDVPVNEERIVGFYTR